MQHYLRHIVDCLEPLSQLRHQNVLVTDILAPETTLAGHFLKVTSDLLHEGLNVDLGPAGDLLGLQYELEEEDEEVDALLPEVGENP